MQNGFSFVDALEILKTKQNEKRIDIVIQQLEDGKVLREAFSDLLPKAYRRYFENFILYLPMLESLNISIELANHEEHVRQKMIKDMFYPVMMLIMMLVGMQMFQHFIFPQMMSLMDSFDVNVDHFFYLNGFVQVLSWFVLLFGLLVVMIVLLLRDDKRMCKLYCLFARYHRGSILIQKASNEFARYFLECVKVRISTWQTLDIMKKLENKPLVQLIAIQLSQSLQQGQSFSSTMHSPYVEHALQQFFQIALHGSNCEKMLEGYLCMSQERSARQVKHFTQAIQMICYGMIAIILLIIYQVLMLPMQMLQSI